MSWEWPKTDRAGLARYVLPDAAELFDIGINRNDLSPDANGRRTLLDAIYFSLQSKELRYALEKYNPNDAIQLVRSPSEILGRKEGTCLDLAMLFCGICLGYELLPLMILTEGHAFAAVSLNHDVRTRDAFDRKERRHFTDAILTDVEALRQLVAGGAYVAVECTGFAQSEKLPATHPEGVGRNFRKMLPFERALAAGQEQLNQADRPLVFALDVAAAHDLGFKVDDEEGQKQGSGKSGDVEVGKGLRAKNTKFNEAVGVRGEGTGNVSVLDGAELDGVEIGSIIGVDNTLSSLPPVGPKTKK